jgi:hypothetical protein
MLLADVHAWLGQEGAPGPKVHVPWNSRKAMPGLSIKPLTLDLAQKVFSWEREAGEWQHQADEERMYQDMAHQALAEKAAELTECKKAFADLQAFLAFKKQEEADLEEEEMQKRAANVGKHGGWLPKMAHMCALVFCKRWKEVEAKAWEHYGTNATFKLVCDKEYYKLP